MKRLLALGLLLSGSLFTSALPIHASTLTLTDVGGGALSEPVANGHYLYVGTGGTLTTWNMADPKHPVVASRTSLAPSMGIITAVHLVGDHLYALWADVDLGGGLEIYSLSDPARPEKIADRDYIEANTKRPKALAVSGSHVFIGDSERGLIVLDASDTLNPVPIARLEGVTEFESMQLIGDRLYAIGTNFAMLRVAQIIDIEDPANPSPLAQVSLGDANAVLRSVIAGHHAISVGHELQVYDLSDPGNAALVFSTEIDEATHALPLGDALYLVGNSGVQVWDFSRPTQPLLLRTVVMDALAPARASATPFGPLILTQLDHGFLLDTTDRFSPTLTSSFILPYGVQTSAGDFDGRYAYFAQQNYGLSALDAGNLGFVGRLDADLPPFLDQRSMDDISVDQGRGYIAAWGYGLLIADLSNPAAPSELGRFPLTAASAVEAHGDRVYVGSAGDGTFMIMDVADPLRPKPLGALRASKTLGLTVRGNHAYLADQSTVGGVGGLRIVDISNPAAPRLVSHQALCRYADGLDVSADGNTVYLACASNADSGGDLRIIDTTHRGRPMPVATVPLPGTALSASSSAHAVVVIGATAYVGNTFGVDEIDVSDPSNPAWKQRHNTAFNVRKLAMGPGGRLHAFSFLGGTYVFTVDPVFASGFD